MILNQDRHLINNGKSTGNAGGSVSPHQGPREAGCALSKTGAFHWVLVLARPGLLRSQPHPQAVHTHNSPAQHCWHYFEPEPEFKNSELRAIAVRGGVARCGNAVAVQNLAHGITRRVRASTDPVRPPSPSLLPDETGTLVTNPAYRPGSRGSDGKWTVRGHTAGK